MKPLDPQDLLPIRTRCRDIPQRGQPIADEGVCAVSVTSTTASCAARNPDPRILFGSVESQVDVHWEARNA